MSNTVQIVIGVIAGIASVVCFLLFGYRSFVLGCRRGRADALKTTDSGFKEQG